MHVTIYTKPGCHLCEDVLVILDRLTQQYDLVVDEVNILDDMALYEAYGQAIPVVKIEDGRLGTLQAPLEEVDLRAAFEIARRGLPPTPPAGRTGQQPPRESVLDRMASYVARHWVRLATVVLAVFVGLPWLAAVFAWLGWWGIADPIYTFYALTCHQLPERAGSVFDGYQVAFCYRNTALYGGVLLFGFLYGLARDRDVSRLRWLKRPIPWWAAALLVLPMFVDGMTHLLGLRDDMMSVSGMSDPMYGSFLVGSQVGSLNWWLRVLTGLLAALGAVWFAYPRMERTLEESEAMRLMYRQSAVNSRSAILPGNR